MGVGVGRNRKLREEWRENGKEVQLCWLSITFNRLTMSTVLPWIQARVSQPTDSFPTHNSPFVCMCKYECIWAKVWMGMHEETQSWCGEWSFISLLSYMMRENHFLTSKAHGSEGNKIINSALICVGAYMYREAQGQCQKSFSIPLPPYSVRQDFSNSEHADNYSPC